MFASKSETLPWWSWRSQEFALTFDNRHLNFAKLNACPFMMFAQYKGWDVYKAYKLETVLHSGKVMNFISQLTFSSQKMHFYTQNVAPPAMIMSEKVSTFRILKESKENCQFYLTNDSIFHLLLNAAFPEADRRVWILHQNLICRRTYLITWRYKYLSVFCGYGQPRRLSILPVHDLTQSCWWPLIYIHPLNESSFTSSTLIW